MEKPTIEEKSGMTVRKRRAQLGGWTSKSSQTDTEVVTGPSWHEFDFSPYGTMVSQLMVGWLVGRIERMD